MARFFFFLGTGVVDFLAETRMNENPPIPAPRRRGRRFLKWLLGLTLLAFVVVQVLNLLAKHALNRYERQWEAKGEHFDFASFIPKPVPDDQNFALTPIVASCYEKELDKSGHRIDPPNTNVTNRLAMEIFDYWEEMKVSTNIGNWAKGTKTDLKGFQSYYRALAAKTNEFPVAPQMQSPAADVLLALSRYDSDIEELRRAAALPYSRFPLNYNTNLPADTLIPHLGALKRCNIALALRAVAELQDNHSEKALADVKLMLQLNNSTRTEPMMISHLVRIALLNITLQPVWEGLQDHKWSDAQLVELNQELAKLDFLADYEFSMRGERASMLAIIEYMRRTRNLDIFEDSSIDTDDSDNTAKWIKKLARHLIPNSVFYQNELTVARAHQEWFLPIVDVGRHNVSPTTALLANNNIEQLGVHWSPNTLIARMFLPAITAYTRKWVLPESSCLE
jgi:hypothetical protein